MQKQNCFSYHYSNFILYHTISEAVVARHNQICTDIFMMFCPLQSVVKGVAFKIFNL